MPTESQPGGEIPMNFKIGCRTCGKQQVVRSYLANKRAHAGLPNPCESCGADLNQVGQQETHRGLPDNLRRSRRQEKQTAAREGGKCQPASGSVSGFEGDTRVVGKYRGENKFTRADSYRLKLEDLQKLENQATCGEFPIFDIEFQGICPTKRYVVMPEWVYETLMHDSGRRNRADTTPHPRGA